MTITDRPLEEPTYTRKPAPRGWVKGTALLACGLTLGAIIGSSGGRAATSAAEARAAEAEQQAAAAQEQAAADKEDYIAEYEDRVAAVAEREADATAKEQAVAQREAAVTQTEQAVDASKIAPGTYLVPEELTAGRYRTVGEVTGYCYMSQDRGDEIVNNVGEFEGRPVFVVEDIPGTTFKIGGGCGPVQKI